MERYGALVEFLHNHNNVEDPAFRTRTSHVKDSRLDVYLDTGNIASAKSLPHTAIERQ